VTEDEQIEAGQRIAAFLEDEAVKRALQRLAAKYYDEFKAARTAEGRESAHSKAMVLDDFANEMRSVVDTGKRVKAEVQRRARGR